jgi:hypothetical protein
LLTDPSLLLPPGRRADECESQDIGRERERKRERERERENSARKGNIPNLQHLLQAQRDTGVRTTPTQPQETGTQFHRREPNSPRFAFRTGRPGFYSRFLMGSQS